MVNAWSESLWWGMWQVQKDIREGHQQTVDKVLALLDAEGGVSGATVCDAGCGTGSLAIPLALRVCPALSDPWYPVTVSSWFR